MHYLSCLRAPNGAQVDARGMCSSLQAVENAMYHRGWTVIGSVFKASKLHPWKVPAREQLHQWAQQDLCCCRANALNLRLADTNTIALDCDFHDAELMSRFISALQLRLGLHKEQLFTCVGKKGGKIFFCFVPTCSYDPLPRTLGPTVFTQGHLGDSAYKQELEVKSDLSTIAGLYGPFDVAINDTIVYGPYEDYPYIVEATPSDLPTITSHELQSVGNLFYTLVKQGGYECDTPNTLQVGVLEHEFMCACVVLCICECYVTIQDLVDQYIVDFSDAKECAQYFGIYEDEFRPLLRFMGQDLTCELIEHVLLDQPLRSPLLAQDAKKLLATFTADSRLTDHADLISRAYSIFLNSTEYYHQLLLNQACKHGIEPQPIIELCKELQDKLWSKV